jgi:hypothetical protein
LGANQGSAEIFPALSSLFFFWRIGQRFVAESLLTIISTNNMFLEQPDQKP